MRIWRRKSSRDVRRREEQQGKKRSCERWSGGEDGDGAVSVVV